MSELQNEPGRKAQTQVFMQKLLNEDGKASEQKGRVTSAENRLLHMGFSKKAIKAAKPLIKAGDCSEFAALANEILELCGAYGLSVKPNQLDMLDEGLVEPPLDEKSYEDGLLAGRLGEDPANPYQETHAMSEWQRGYNDGRQEREIILSMPEPEAAKRGRPRNEEIAEDAEAQGVDLSPPDEDEEADDQDADGVDEGADEDGEERELNADDEFYDSAEDAEDDEDSGLVQEFEGQVSRTENSE